MTWRKVLLAMMLGLGSVPAHADALTHLQPGTGHFAFTDRVANPGQAITVWYAMPARADAHSPIVFVMPGAQRNGADYRDIWAPFARQANALLLVPEFPSSAYPAPHAYNLGNMVDAEGGPRAREQWTFNLIEQLFDDVRLHTKNEAPAYYLYGHSAGAQFVQRLMMFMPEARVARAVAANAGWHTLPDYAEPFPYGLGGIELSAVALKQALERDVVLMLGELDTDKGHARLRNTPETARQGAHRLARGQTFDRRARQAATAVGATRSWRVLTVPGVGHSNKAIAPAAARELFR